MIIITTKSMEKRSMCTKIKNVLKNRNVTDSKNLLNTFTKAEYISRIKGKKGIAGGGLV